MALPSRCQAGAAARTGDTCVSRWAPRAAGDEAHGQVAARQPGGGLHEVRAMVEVDLDVLALADSGTLRPRVRELHSSTALQASEVVDHSHRQQAAAIPDP